MIMLRFGIFSLWGTSFSWKRLSYALLSDSSVNKNNIWKKPCIKKSLQSATFISTIFVNCAANGKNRLLSSCLTREFHRCLLQQESIKSPGKILGSVVVLRVWEWEENISPSPSIPQACSLLPLSFKSQFSLSTIFGFHSSWHLNPRHVGPNFSSLILLSSARSHKISPGPLMNLRLSLIFLPKRFLSSFLKSQSNLFLKPLPTTPVSPLEFRASVCNHLPSLMTFSFQSVFPASSALLITNNSFLLTPLLQSWVAVSGTASSQIQTFLCLHSSEQLFVP